MDQLLIVGGGLAGTLLALECKERGIGFRWVVTDEVAAASKAAYGMCNPVHLRNQVPVWRASKLFEVSRKFFHSWTQQLSPELLLDMPVNHLITDKDESIKWRQNAESTELWRYSTGEEIHRWHTLLNPEFIAEIRIKEAFYLNIADFIIKTRSFLQENIIPVQLNWEEVDITGGNVKYKDHTYHKILVADGMGSTKNPFFQGIPFNPCKGEVLHLKIEGLNLKEAIHKKIVLLPLADGTYLCGATYEWNDLSDETTVEGRNELMDQLSRILDNRYPIEIIGQKAGVRPAISDRRPVVGWHPVYTQVGILNGFGTRGLLLGPATCKNLLNNYQLNEPILPDWNVQRFNKRLTKK